MLARAAPLPAPVEAAAGAELTDTLTLPPLPGMAVVTRMGHSAERRRCKTMFCVSECVMRWYSALLAPRTPQHGLSRGPQRPELSKHSGGTQCSR
jgi:hypothetical protein